MWNRFHCISGESSIMGRSWYNLLVGFGRDWNKNVKVYNCYCFLVFARGKTLTIFRNQKLWQFSEIKLCLIEFYGDAFFLLLCGLFDWKKASCVHKSLPLERIALEYCGACLFHGLLLQENVFYECLLRIYSVGLVYCFVMVLLFVISCMWFCFYVLIF